MSRIASLVIVCVALGVAPALAAPVTRVVLADSDPELRLAVQSALAPWRAQIVVESVGADTASAAARADAHAARFVVWREGGQLVVFDRDSANAERRTAHAGALDPVAAAAAALTIKTMMRLPPPEPENVVVEHRNPVPTPVVAPRELRVQVGGSSRIARGSETERGARALATVMLRPWAERGLRFGLAGELGTTATVERSGFKGTWQDWSLTAEASWTHRRRRWELEPYAGVGFVRSTLRGIEMGDVRAESATLLAVEAGAWGRRRFGTWSIAAGPRFQILPSTPTYTKDNDGKATVFAVPGFTVGVGLVVAADLGL